MNNQTKSELQSAALSDQSKTNRDNHAREWQTRIDAANADTAFIEWFKRYNDDDGSFNGMYSGELLGAHDAFTAGRASVPVFGEWVKIGDGCAMPEVGTEVLAVALFGGHPSGLLPGVTTLTWDGRDWRDVFEGLTWESEIVTHWMPLPPEPKE